MKVIGNIVDNSAVVIKPTSVGCVLLESNIVNSGTLALEHDVYITDCVIANVNNINAIKRAINVVIDGSNIVSMDELVLKHNDEIINLTNAPKHICNIVWSFVNGDGYAGLTVREFLHKIGESYELGSL